MSLGEAFVEIRADLRPFGRDLRRSVRPMVEAFERELNNAVGRSMLTHSESQGRQVGDRVSQGIKKSLTHQFQNKNAFVVIASTLAGALDDGISALPTEVKAAIVAGILAATPLVAGALAGAISAGVGVGVAGLGILLASQYDEVQKRATEFGRTARKELVESAAAFVPAIINALDIVESRIRQNRGMLDQIFNVSANFLEPVTQGALDAFQSLIVAIFNSLEKLKPFIDELGAAIATLGDGVAQALEILIATGEDGQAAFRDLVAIMAIVLLSITTLIFALTKLYGAFRTVINVIADIVGPFQPFVDLIDRFFDTIDRRTNASKSFINTNTAMVSSVSGLIVATKGETDALKEYTDAIKDASDAAKSNLELNISWEESLDSIAEALKRNGKTLDVHTEKGRANIKEFLDGLKIAEERAMLRVQRGEQTAEQAAFQYQQEVAALRNLATQAGISEQAFNDLFYEITTTSALRISSTEMGVDALGNSLSDSATAAQRLLEMLQLIRTLSLNIGRGAIGGVRGFAEGGILHTPEIIRAAEAGPEVIIPLTRPARAAQLAQESGLTAILGNSGPSQILVFIGSEQLEAKMVKVVERTSRNQALALSQGPRRF